MIRVGEKTQPRAPHLFTGSGRLHCLALQEKEHSLHMPTSTRNFSIQPICALIMPGIQTPEGQAMPELPRWREVMVWHSSPVPWSPSPGGDLPDHLAPCCQWTHRTTERGPDFRINPHRQGLSLLTQVAFPPVAPQGQRCPACE